MAIEIPDIEKAHKEYKDLKRCLNKYRAKLKSLYLKYSFLNEIINPDCKGDQLENSIAELFNDLGLRIEKPKVKADLDLYIMISKDERFGIEVKGEAGLGENEILQVYKYAQRIRNETPGAILHPILIWNNSKHNNDFSANMITDATINGYGILTTHTLRVGYLQVKQKKINLDLFVKVINQTGLINFTHKHIKNMDSGASL